MSGIYIHVPFCKSKCTYCDFASYPKETGKADAYFACLYREMKGRSESLKNKTFDTVYFGGGTPSFVDPKYIYGAMKQLRNFYNIAKDAEITLELNPGTMTEEKHATYKLCGVNRYSVGLQSADDELLKDLNRIHTAEDFINTTRILNGENFSADVML
ncbi:MAG: radical SAM protein [Clostridia bacterium]|nr:radical SAM protein [Clostridia bacterium]